MFSMNTLKLGINGWNGRLPDGRRITIQKLDEDMDSGYWYLVKFQGVEVLKGWFDGFNMPDRAKALNDSNINALLKTPEQMKESIHRTGISDAPADILEALKDALDGGTTEQVASSLEEARANALDLLQILDRMLETAGVSRDALYKGAQH